MNNNTYIIKVKVFKYIQKGKFDFTEKKKLKMIDAHVAITDRSSGSMIIFY